jgi:hypothetical protein
MGGGGGTSTKKVKKQADYQYGLDQRAMQDQLEANRVNQTNPWGSVSWTQDPSGKWTQTTTLDPAEQQRLDQQRGLLTGLGNVASPIIGQVGQSISTPLDFSGMAPGPTGAPGVPQYNTNFGSVDPALLAQMGQVGAGASFGGASSGVERAREYELQKKLDLSGLSALPEASEAARQQVIDAMYGQAQSRLAPQFEQQRREQLDRLYAMGGREGDPVFEQQRANLERQITDANQQALWNAINAGGAEQSRLFGLGMANRQQTFNEALQGGQFTNEALMNQFQQGAFNAGQANQVGMANAANANAAGIASMNAANQRDIFNAGQRQQGLLAGLEFNRAGTQLGNTLAQQGFQNQLAQNAEQSRIRDQQIQEALLQRGLPMQELGSVLGMMGQVQNPEFGSYAQGQIQAPDYLGAYNANQALKAQAQQGMMSGLGALAGVAGSALGGPIGGAIAKNYFG